MHFRILNWRSIGNLFFLGAGIALFVQTAVAETILLQNGIIHTVTGPTISNGSVAINGSKIEKVSDGKEPLNFKANQVIDLKGGHLYPGLIALDTALGLTEIGGVRSTRDTTEVGEFTPDVQSWIAVNPDSELIPVARANGVVCIEPAPQGGIVAGQSGLVVLDGWTMEQMAYRKPVALHVYWPEMGLNTTPKEKFKDQSKFKSLEDQSKEREKKIKAIDDFFRDALAYAKLKEAAEKKPNSSFEKTPAWEAMLPFVHGELPLAIHADDIREIKSAVKWAATNQFKMILVGGRDAWKAPELLATNKIPILYEHVFTQPATDTEPYDIHFKAQAMLQKAGVKVATGMGATTFDAALIKNLPYQAAQAVAFGFPREEALKSITLYPAELAGVSATLGSIEADKDATLFVTDGDILDIRSNVKRMWIAGKEISLENRHTRLYQKYKNRPKAQ